MKRLSKYLLLLSIFLLAGHVYLNAQPCLPEGITFFTQSKIDNFPLDYPNCTEIEGSVMIIGNDIKNLKGLNAITFIGNGLAVMLCDSLTTFSGLDNLTHIEGGTDWGMNNSLVSLDGLQNLTYIGGTLFIHENPKLTDLSALENLSVVSGNIFLTNNNLLTTLSGIDYLDSDSITGVGLRNNPFLSICNVESICNFLANPSGPVEIENNGQGCYTIQQVEEACMVGILERQTTLQISAFPNPFTTSTTIEYELYTICNIQYSVYNMMGDVVFYSQENMLPPGRHTLTWSPGHLPAGLYYAVLRSGDEVSVVKMVKE